MIEAQEWFVPLCRFICYSSLSAMIILWVDMNIKEKSERISVGGIVPEQPKPEPCYLTQQIHEAAKEAGLCLECGSPKQYSGSDENYCWCGDSLFALDRKVDWLLSNLMAEKKADHTHTPQA